MTLASVDINKFVDIQRLSRDF